MSQYDPKKIEEMQMALLKNPRSPLFAALSEAYRKMGFLEEALEATTRGVKHNPEYVSGLVAHAKVLFDLKDYRKALEFLKKANALKPENILALRLLGHCCLKLRQHREALSYFKKLMVLQPSDETAIQFVKKWQFLENVPTSTDESRFHVDGYDQWIQNLPSDLEAVHLIDSFLNYGDREVAKEIAVTAQMHWPQSQTLKARQEMLFADGGSPMPRPQAAPNLALEALETRKAIYQKWLQRIEQLKNIDPL